MPTKKLNAVAAYVYAGGFSIGVRSTGLFDILGHLEDPKPYGKEVIDLNRELYWGTLPVNPFPDWPDGRADLLYANPPCAPFSSANPRSFTAGSYTKDPRLSCWYNVVRYGLKNRIPFMAIETTNTAYNRAPEFFAEIAEWLNTEGYSVDVFLHNAAFFGSVQNRNRVLLLASTYELRYFDFYNGIRLTVGELFKSLLKKIPNDWLIPGHVNDRLLLPETKPGERIINTWNRLNPPNTRTLNKLGQVRGRPSHSISRLHPDKLAHIAVGHEMVHPVKDRFLTLKEYQAVHDFPIDYELPKHNRSMNYVSRGVSPHVGAWVARTAAVTLTRPKPITEPGTRVVDGLSGFSGMKFYDLDEWFDFPKLSTRARLK